MQHEAIVYSLDPKITLKDIRDQANIECDTNKYTKLQERIKEQGV